MHTNQSGTSRKHTVDWRKGKIIRVQQVYLNVLPTGIIFLLHTVVLCSTQLHCSTRHCKISAPIAATIELNNLLVQRVKLSVKWNTADNNFLASRVK